MLDLHTIFSTLAFAIVMSGFAAPILAQGFSFTPTSPTPRKLRAA